MQSPAASRALRDGLCDPRGRRLIGPLAALCEKAVRAAEAAQQCVSGPAALAQPSHDSGTRRVPAYLMVALWSAACAAVDGGPPDDIQQLLAAADEVARVPCTRRAGAPCR